MKKKIQDVIQQEFKGLWGTDFSDDGIPVIKTNNMTYEGRIDFSDICKRNIGFDEASPNFLQKGDLIIEKSGGTKTHSVGYVNIFEGEDNKYICNNFILPLRPNKELVDCKYLFWQLHGMYEAGKFADCYNKTTGIQNLQKKTYFSKQINVPSKVEQQKIAAELDTIQSAIDNKKQQLSLLDEAVKSEFVEMFGDDSCKQIPFSQYAEIIDGDRGKNYPKAEDFSDDGYCLFLSAKNVTKNGFIFESNQFISKEKDEILRKGKLNRGDIVITTRGTIGNIAYYDDSVPYENIRINSGMVIIRNKDLEFNQRFFLEAFRNKIDDIIATQVTGAAQPQLPIHIMSKITLPYPDITLQNKFSTFVQQIDKSKFVVKQQILDLQELLDSKMQEYFS